jgi:hypothetical protein
MPAPRSNLIHGLFAAMLTMLMPTPAEHAKMVRPGATPIPFGRQRTGAAEQKRASRRRRNIAKHNRSAAQ